MFWRVGIIVDIIFQDIFVEHISDTTVNKGVFALVLMSFRTEIKVSLRSVVDKLVKVVEKFAWCCESLFFYFELGFGSNAALIVPNYSEI